MGCFAARMKTPEQLRSYRWFGPDDLRSFGHRSRTKQMGYSAEDFMGKPVVGILNTWSDLATIAASSTSYSDTTAPEAATTYYRVVATNAGASDPSCCAARWRFARAACFITSSRPATSRKRKGC